MWLESPLGSGRSRISKKLEHGGSIPASEFPVAFSIEVEQVTGIGASA